MPKQKTKSGAKKRFKFTANGHVKVAAAGKRHGMIKRTTKFIRKARGTMVLRGPRRAASSRNTCPTTADLTGVLSEMARVKRGVTAHAKHKKVLDQAKGYYGRRKNSIKTAKAGGGEGQPVRLSRPQEPQAELPRAVDPAHQRSVARASV